MPGERVLIIGGTRDGRLLAAALIAAGFVPVTSMAGITRAPLIPQGAVRIGSFGGARGLAAFVAEANIRAMIDAAHPFALRISTNVAQAAAMTGVPHLQFERLLWAPGPQDRWIGAKDAGEAAAMITPGSRVLLTIGRRGLEEFFRRKDLTGIVRTIELPATPIPGGWALLQARPPFQLEDEIALMKAAAIDVLVTKNSGGPADAKLAAARRLELPVVMIARPQKPDGMRASSIDEAVAWLRQTVGGDGA
jgi:precorrin-6A/cobalt-precorrin-6A reductase